MTQNIVRLRPDTDLESGHRAAMIRPYWSSSTLDQSHGWAMLLRGKKTYR